MDALAGRVTRRERGSEGDPDQQSSRRLLRRLKSKSLPLTDQQAVAVPRGQPPFFRREVRLRRPGECHRSAPMDATRMECGSRISQRIVEPDLSETVCTRKGDI